MSACGIREAEHEGEYSRLIDPYAEGSALPRPVASERAIGRAERLFEREALRHQDCEPNSKRRCRPRVSHGDLLLHKRAVLDAIRGEKQIGYRVDDRPDAAGTRG